MSNARLYLAYDLGTIGYQYALQIQRRLVEIVSQGLFDVLLLLQHPSCLTIGRFKGSEDIIAPQEILATEGISILHTDRGGGVTYHGPGQLIGYPILNLKENKLSIRQYIWKLEEAILKTLLDLGIALNVNPNLFHFEFIPSLWNCWQKDDLCL